MHRQVYHKSSNKFIPKEKEKKQEIFEEKILIDKIQECLTASNVDSFSKSFQSFFNMYFKTTASPYSVSSLHTNTLFGRNANEDRIKKYKLIKIIFSNMNVKYKIPDNPFHKIILRDESDDDNYDGLNVARFWLKSTNMVSNNFILGFPLCVYNSRINFTPNYFNNKEKTNSLFFLKHIESVATPLYDIVTTNYKPILFQKILIFYHLYNEGFYSSNYIYEEINMGSEVKFTFKIKDIIFDIKIKKIIILSPKTVLINSPNNIEVSNYLDSLEKEELEELTNKNYDNFYELLLENFNKYFLKDVYNTANVYMMLDRAREVTNLTPGNLYILKRGESLPTFIILTRDNGIHLKYIVLFDNKSKKNTFSLRVEAILRSESDDFLFYYPDILFEESLFDYVIGDYRWGQYG